MKPKLHFSGIYKFSYEAFKQHAGLLAALTLFSVVVLLAPILIAFAAQSIALMIIAYLIDLVLAFVLFTIYSYALVLIAKGETVTFKQALEAWKKSPVYFGVIFLYSIIVLGGTLLLVVPGLIWSCKFYLAPMILLAEGKSVTDSLHESSVRTEGYKFDVFASMSLMNQLATYAILPAYYLLLIIFFVGGAVFSAGGSSVGSMITLSVIGVIVFIALAILAWVLLQIVTIASNKAYVELSK
tara:strand:+ start:139 stop:861 length:723 start_codon:yes stop_codon:yes gene_type:complete